MKPYYSHAGIEIYCGDCKEILPSLPKCDLLLTDPPYGLKENAHRVASRGKLAATTDYGSFEWDSEPASDALISLCVASAKESIIWGGNYFTVPPSRGWLVWDKRNGGNCFADCELAWTNLKTSVRMFSFLWNGMMRAGEWKDKPRVHPAQKPVELMHWCLSFAPEAKLVLDPFTGSGTALVAAKNAGKQAIGIDREERYCEIAAKRLAQEVFQFPTEAA